MGLVDRVPGRPVRRIIASRNRSVVGIVSPAEREGAGGGRINTMEERR